MATMTLRDKAIKLRKLGKTYGNIKRELNVPKSTLSNWLSKYPLSKSQIKDLELNRKKSRQIAIEKTTQTKFKKRKERLDKIYNIEKKDLLPLTQKEIYLCGLFLYSGEGVKGLKTAVSLNNTDSSIVKFYRFWLTDVLDVPLKKLRVSLHIYDDMDVEKTITYWSKLLKISRSQFIKPYIKKSIRNSINQKGYGNGTCGIYVYDQKLKEKIILGLSAIMKSVTGISQDLI